MLYSFVILWLPPSVCVVLHVCDLKPTKCISCIPVCDLLFHTFLGRLPIELKFRTIATLVWSIVATIIYSDVTNQCFFSAVFGAEIRPHSPRQKVCFFPLFWKKIPLKMKYSKKKISKMWRQRVRSAYKFVPCISHAVNLWVASLGDR